LARGKKGIRPGLPAKRHVVRRGHGGRVKNKKKGGGMGLTLSGCKRKRGGGLLDRGKVKKGSREELSYCTFLH